MEKEEEKEEEEKQMVEEEVEMEEVEEDEEEEEGEEVEGEEEEGEQAGGGEEACIQILPAVGCGCWVMGRVGPKQAGKQACCVHRLGLKGCKGAAAGGAVRRCRFAFFAA